MAAPLVVTSLTAEAAGAELAPILHATGIPAEMDWIDYLTMQGYVFISASNNLGNFELGETGADNQDIDPLEPSYMFDVPTGITVIPLWANVAFEVVTGTDTILAAVSCENEAYSSGGTAALAVQNARTDAPRTSGVKNIYAVGESSGDITAATLVAPRTLWMWSSPTDASGGDPFIVEWRPAVHSYLVGPASFLFYCHAIGTEAKYRATFSWAEVPSAIITKP